MTLLLPPDGGATRSKVMLSINAVEISRSWASTEARRQEVLEAEFLVYANSLQQQIDSERPSKKSL